MSKLTLLAAFGAGYVLGAKAGRGRYEEIRSTFQSVKENPRVQQAAATVSDTAKERGPVVADKVSGAATGLAASARDKVSSTSGPDESRVDELHPDSTARQDDPYPQGNLP